MGSDPAKKTLKRKFDPDIRRCSYRLSLPSLLDYRQHRRCSGLFKFLYLLERCGYGFRLVRQHCQCFIVQRGICLYELLKDSLAVNNSRNNWLFIFNNILSLPGIAVRQQSPQYHYLNTMHNNSDPDIFLKRIFDLDVFTNVFYGAIINNGI